MLSARRVSGLISNLDMLGLISAKTVSKEDMVVPKQINPSLPANIDAQKIITQSEPLLNGIFTHKYRYQSKL